MTSDTLVDAVTSVTIVGTVITGGVVSTVIEICAVEAELVA